MNSTQKELEKGIVYFDGLCKVCSTEINHYRRLEGSESFNFVDITATDFDPSVHGLDPKNVHKVMHVKDKSGNLHTGVDAFKVIWEELPRYRFLSKLSEYKVVRSVLDTGYNAFVIIRPFLPRRKARLLKQSSLWSYKMISYPILFAAKASSDPGIQTSWYIESQNLKSNCAIPPEFEGPGGALSPEDLFAQALTGCFLATFKVYAEKSRLVFNQVSADSELVVDLDENKKPVMKKFILNATITGCENKDRIRTLAERAFASGFILNSVKTELHLNLNIVD